MAMAAASSLARGPYCSRRRSSHLSMAPTSPQAVSATPTMSVPLRPKMRGSAASVSSRTPPETQALPEADEASVRFGYCCPRACHAGGCPALLARTRMPARGSPVGAARPGCGAPMGTGLPDGAVSAEP